MFETAVYLSGYVVAGLYRVTDESSVPEIAQYGPYYIPFNVFTTSKGPSFDILFAITAAGVVSCGGPRSLSVHHP